MLHTPSGKLHLTIFGTWDLFYQIWKGKYSRWKANPFLSFAATEMSMSTHRNVPAQLGRRLKHKKFSTELNNLPLTQTALQNYLPVGTFWSYLLSPK